MFCDGCGAAVQPGQGFCSRCGKQVVGPVTAMQLRTGRVHGHVHLLGIFWLALSAFNTIGGDLFRDITRKNVPDPGATESTSAYRHLAIILDGLIMSAPTINSEISPQGQISGSFTQKEVTNLVNILRAGRLPVDQLLTHRLKLGEINEGFDRLRDGVGIRQVIIFD